MSLVSKHIELGEELMWSGLRCNFCGGFLGATEHQDHDNPGFAKYKTCLDCDYQWAKEYWPWLKRVLEAGKIPPRRAGPLTDALSGEVFT